MAALAGARGSSDDQSNLLFGARQLHCGRGRRAIAHRDEELPDRHSSVDDRLDESRAVLDRVLTV
jgi:hypothetical protein